MGSTGDPPVPVGDSPTGRARRPLSKGPSLLAPGALPVPPGESPGGTGQWPVLPKNERPDTLLATDQTRIKHGGIGMADKAKASPSPPAAGGEGRGEAGRSPNSSGA